MATQQTGRRLALPLQQLMTAPGPVLLLLLLLLLPLLLLRRMASPGPAAPPRQSSPGRGWSARSA
jgi:hypothetical protein